MYVLHADPMRKADQDVGNFSNRVTTKYRFSDTGSRIRDHPITSPCATVTFRKASIRSVCQKVCLWNGQQTADKSIKPCGSSSYPVGDLYENNYPILQNLTHRLCKIYCDKKINSTDTRQRFV